MADQLIECAGCAELFEFDEGEQAFFAERGYRPPRRCRECRRKLHRPGAEPLTLTCMDCYAQFEHSVVEQALFAAKSYPPPKRCLPCRRAKRQMYAGLYPEP